MEEQFPAPRNTAASKIGNASFRCYDNSDVIVTLIITNFHLYIIQQWCQFFKIFVYGDVVYAQTWEILTLKNCIEPPKSYLKVSTLADTGSSTLFFRPQNLSTVWLGHEIWICSFSFSVYLRIKLKIVSKVTRFHGSKREILISIPKESDCGRPQERNLKSHV